MRPLVALVWMMLAGFSTSVAGADDTLTPVACAEELVGGIAVARLEVIAQAGHQMPLEQSEEFNRLAGDFAERCG